MKPNPEQDADRAAFEKAAKVYMWEYGPFLRDCNDIDATRTYELHHVEDAWNMWQAAKADSRAMQDAFEQVCHRLGNIKYALNNEANALHTIGNEVSYGLMVAAPFRKKGV